MGFYFRKSISFGGVRFNFSKSGIGVSVGFKGFRIGTGPRGNYVHMGANGLYYRASLGAKKIKNSIPSNVDNIVKNNEKSDLNFVSIESSEITQIMDSSSVELLNEIQGKLKKIPFWPFGLLLSLAHPLLGILAAIVLYQVDRYRKTVILLYDIDETIEKELQNFYDSFEEIKSCSMIWHVQAKARTTNYKYYSGARTIIQRNSIKIIDKCPKYMKTNVKVPCIPVGQRKLYFFPDRIFIYEGNKVGSLSYSSFKIEHDNTLFIEEGIVPNDGIIVDYTWKYVNKDGGPDLRFNNNRKLQILSYSEIRFTSDTGLNECIQLSRPNVGINLINALSTRNMNIRLQEGR